HDRQRHCRVVMCTGDVATHVHHGHEHRADRERRERRARENGESDGQHQEERADELRHVILHAPSSPVAASRAGSGGNLPVAPRIVYRHRLWPAHIGTATIAGRSSAPRPPLIRNPMNRRMLRVALPLVLIVAAGPAGAAVVSRPDTLSDSTVVRNWTLANGLRVTTRHVPGARAVAITVGYSVGTDDDPPGREGLADALGELSFLSAAGDIPARTTEELDSQR